MNRPTPPNSSRARRSGPPAAPPQMSAAFAGAIDLSALVPPPANPHQSLSGAAPGAGSDAVSPPSAASNAVNAPGAAGDADESAPRSRFVLDVDEESFQQVVQLSTEVLVVVDLWASWCEPCKQLSPMLEQLAEADGGSWILAKVDVDASPRIAQAFGVQSIPTVVAIAAGQPVDAFAGIQPLAQLRQWLSGLLDSLRDKLPGIKLAEDANGGPAPVPEDPRFTAAEELIAHEQYDRAAAAYQDILNVEPANAQAAAALASVVFLARVSKLSPAVVEVAESAPDDFQVQRDAADVELAAGEPGKAFDRLIAAIRRAPEDQRTPLREHLVGLFAILGTDDPQVVSARRALAAALY